MRIVALHGQMGMVSDWDSQCVAFATMGYDLDAVDLWSYLERGELSLREFGGILNKKKEDGQVLLGYSMGGRLALHALIDNPLKWKAAVIISAHTGLAENDRESRCKIDHKWASKVVKIPWQNFIHDWNMQAVLGGNVMQDRSILENRKNEIARSFRCWGLSEQEDLLDELKQIDIPVLWIVGENDEKFCKVGERAVEVMKNAEIVKIGNVGHRVPWEAEAEFLREVARFLGEVL